QETLARGTAVLRYKSAKYTVERPLQRGAARATRLAGGPLAAALSRYGRPRGAAPQPREGVLGGFGAPRGTGHPAGGDLRGGGRGGGRWSSGGPAMFWRRCGDCGADGAKWLESGSRRGRGGGEAALAGVHAQWRPLGEG